MSEVWTPSWHKEHEARRKATFQNVRVPTPVKMRESLSDAGWHDRGQEFTCVPDTEHPWTPDVLKAIWTFDPNVVPLWIRWKFQRYDGTKTEVQIFGRHGIGRVVDNPHSALIPFRCDMPQMPCNGVTFKKPNLIELILMKADAKADEPGSFVPWNMDLYNFLRERYKEQTPKEAMRQVNLKLEAAERHKEHLMEEFLYARKDLEKFVNKKLEEAGDVETKRHFSAAFRGNKPTPTRVTISLSGTTPEPKELILP